MWTGRRSSRPSLAPDLSQYDVTPKKLRAPARAGAVVVVQFVLARIQEREERFLAAAGLCENTSGALRLSSGRTDKYLISEFSLPFVVSQVEP
jgi:hypothetical protein